MKNDRLLSPLRQSVRQFNRHAIEFHLGRLLKNLSDPAASQRLKIEIYLEVVKALRVLNRSVEAAQYADVAVANIPADSLDVLAALKRIRALLYLDSNDHGAALNLIEGCDGMELVLEGGQSLITRSDEDVKVETWLVSVEIALAMNDLESAQKYFDHAVSRLSGEEKTLRQKRINPLERKNYEQYYHDLGQMLSLFGLTLALAQKDGHARAGLIELCRQVEEENNIAAAARKLPNVPLHSKLLCLLNKWLPDEQTPPPGLTYSEARRWAGFTSSETAEKFAGHFAVARPSSDIPSSALVTIPNEIREDESLSMLAPSRSLALDSNGQAEKVLDVTATALERMAQVFQQFETLLPNVKSYINDGEQAADYSKRGFSGHLLDTDLYNFMQNFGSLRFTGYLRLKWDKNLYKMLVLKGILPEIVRCGEAHIYVVEGVVTDATFEGQTETPTISRAQENFILLVRMCLSIGVDDTRPDIVGSAVPEDAVKMRPPLLSVSVNDLLYITSDIESALAGVVDEKQKTAMDVPADQQTNVPLVESTSVATAAAGTNPNPSLPLDIRKDEVVRVKTESAVEQFTAVPTAPDFTMPLDLNDAADDEADLFGLSDESKKKPPGFNRATPNNAEDFWEI